MNREQAPSQRTGYAAIILAASLALASCASEKAGADVPTPEPTVSVSVEPTETATPEPTPEAVYESPWILDLNNSPMVSYGPESNLPIEEAGVYCKLWWNDNPLKDFMSKQPLDFDVHSPDLTGTQIAKFTDASWNQMMDLNTSRTGAPSIESARFITVAKNVNGCVNNPESQAYSFIEETLHGRKDYQFQRTVSGYGSRYTEHTPEGPRESMWTEGTYTVYDRSGEYNTSTIDAYSHYSFEGGVWRLQELYNAINGEPSRLNWGGTKVEVVQQ